MSTLFSTGEKARTSYMLGDHCINWVTLPALWSVITFLFCFFQLFVFQDMISLCRPACPRTCFVDQAGLKRMKICLPQIVRIKSVHHTTQPGFNFQSELCACYARDINYYLCQHLPSFTRKHWQVGRSILNDAPKPNSTVKVEFVKIQAKIWYHSFLKEAWVRGGRVGIVVTRMHEALRSTPSTT